MMSIEQDREPRKSSELRYSPGGTTDLGEGKLNTPDFTLVSEAELADGLELGIPKYKNASIPSVQST